VIVGAVALAFGTIVAALAEPRCAARNIGIVCFYVFVVVTAYTLILSGLGAATAPPGSRGGPGVYPPPSRGGPAVYPPVR
jgi:hypothetical protein